MKEFYIMKVVAPPIFGIIKSWAKSAAASYVLLKFVCCRVLATTTGLLQ